MEDFVVISKVRKGHKRDFAFALKSQNEIAASLGPTRTRKPPIGINGAQDTPKQRCKRLKKLGKGLGLGKRKNGEESEAEEKWRENGGLSDSFGVAKSNAITSESDVDTGDVAEKSCCLSKTRKVRRKREGGGGAEVAIKVVPRKVKDLLRTGLLEGLAVWYRRGLQRNSNSSGTPGVISGSGIKCFCQACSGVADENAGVVVSPNVFEQHAGSRNKRPSDYIYLENGNTLRDVINACLKCKIEDLEATIRNACGLRAAENSSYGSISVSGTGRTWMVSDAGMQFEASEENPESEYQDSEASEGVLEGVSEDLEAYEEISERLTPASETSVDSATGSSEASYGTPEPVVGKSSDGESRKRLTRRHLRRHRLVFNDNNVLPDGTHLFYYFRGKKWLSGYKEGAGIFCTCCQKKVSASQFEAHAGWACHKQPYHHIFTSEGTSLFMLAMSVSEKHKTSIAKVDEVCNICQIEGYSICCDGCPRVFHKECVHLQEVPNGNWYCRSCRYQRHKVAGNNPNAIAAGRAAGIGCKERRCVRLVETEESDHGGCVFCRSHDFCMEEFGPRTIILCDQCEREYHVGCLRDSGMQDLKELPQGNWFCCSGCDRINSTLQQLIDDGGQQIPDTLLNMIEAKHAAKYSEGVKLDVKWRLLSGKMSNVDCVEQLFSDAMSIFHEQFSPIVIPGSKTDLIPCMVFGKNLEDKDFRGMYCAVLTVNSQVVSAGVLRVYGTEIAELPLVATAKYCEKLGYFQALYSCIENLLGKMEVKHLSLPATNEAKPLWTNKLGFSKFPKDELAEVGKWYQLMPFQGTSMLRKAVPSIKDAAQGYTTLQVRSVSMTAAHQGRKDKERWTRRVFS